jgi:hypothetical protein
LTRANQENCNECFHARAYFLEGGGDVCCA